MPLKNFVIWAFLRELQGCARSVRKLDSYMHTSTVRLEGQIFWFWISLNIIGGVAFENFVIWAFLSELRGCARNARALGHFFRRVDESPMYEDDFGVS